MWIWVYFREIDLSQNVDEEFDFALGIWGTGEMGPVLKGGISESPTLVASLLFPFNTTKQGHTLPYGFVKCGSLNWGRVKPFEQPKWVCLLTTTPPTFVVFLFVSL